MTNRPVFGQRVRVNAKLVKRYDRPQFKYPVNTTWQRIAYNVEGIYIGFRTLSEGCIDADYEDGYTYRYFIPKRHMKVWLIVINERSNPIYVLPEDASFEVTEHDETGK